MDGEIRIGLTPKEAATIEIALNNQKKFFEKYLTIPNGTEKNFAQKKIAEIETIIRKINLE